MEILLNSRPGPWILRILVTGSFFALGIFVGWLLGKWRRHRQLREAERGEARDVLTIEKILFERQPDGIEVMRIRSCGRDPIDAVFPNPSACDAFLVRVEGIAADRPLVSMHDRLGSYLLQGLAFWGCGQVGERDFSHRSWVVAPVYERGALYLGGHHSSTILLVRQEYLTCFRDRERCRGIRVEHRSHGERVVTLVRIAEEFDRQQDLDRIVGSRAGGQPMRRRCTSRTSASTRGPSTCRRCRSRGTGSRRGCSCRNARAAFVINSPAACGRGS